MGMQTGIWATIGWIKDTLKAHLTSAELKNSSTYEN